MTEKSLKVILNPNQIHTAIQYNFSLDEQDTNSEIDSTCTLHPEAKEVQHLHKWS